MELVLRAGNQCNDSVQSSEMSSKQEHLKVFQMLLLVTHLIYEFLPNCQNYVQLNKISEDKYYIFCFIIFKEIVYIRFARSNLKIKMKEICQFLNLSFLFFSLDHSKFVILLAIMLAAIITNCILLNNLNSNSNYPGVYPT